METKVQSLWEYTLTCGAEYPAVANSESNLKILHRTNKSVIMTSR